MLLKFGKTIAPHFGRVLQNSQRQLTRHPYLNFLRDYKSKHPKLGMERLLREGAKRWRRLSCAEKENFTQKAVLQNLRADAKVSSTFNLFPTNPLPFDYHARSLSARRNAARRLRNRQLISPRFGKRAQKTRPACARTRRRYCC